MRVTFFTSDKHYEFTPHEDAFAGDGPTAEHLVKFNLNADSLFGSEDSLMDTMALRELELRSMPAMSSRVKLKIKTKTKIKRKP